jgi:hypothetical protein
MVCMGRTSIANRGNNLKKLKEQFEEKWCKVLPARVLF